MTYTIITAKINVSLQKTIKNSKKNVKKLKSPHKKTIFLQSVLRFFSLSVGTFSCSTICSLTATGFQVLAPPPFRPSLCIRDAGHPVLRPGLAGLHGGVRRPGKSIPGFSRDCRSCASACAKPPSMAFYLLASSRKSVIQLGM